MFNYIYDLDKPK